MKHFKQLTPDEYNAVTSPMLIEDNPAFAKGDELVLTMEGHREQAVLTIQSIHREKVHKGYCYLSLGGVDDIKTTFITNLSQQGAEG